MLATIFKLAGALTVGINLVTSSDKETEKTDETVWHCLVDPLPKLGEGKSFRQYYDKYSYTLGFVYLVLAEDEKPKVIPRISDKERIDQLENMILMIMELM